MRKKKNRSGTVSVVVADNSSGRFKELKTTGVSSDPDEITRLEDKARQWIDGYFSRLTLRFGESTQALREARNTITRIERTLQNTPQVILGHMYDRIGFGVIMTLLCAISSSRGKDDNRDYGREVVPALEAVSDGFDVAAVLVDGVEEGVFVAVDVFGPVFAAFIAVDEAGVGFGLDDEDGVGGNDYVIDFGGVSPVVEEQVVDDFVFAVGQAAKDGGDMFLATAAFWDQSAA